MSKIGNVSRGLLLGISLFAVASCAALPQILMTALDMVVPVADVLRRGSTDWEDKLSEVGRTDPEALELAVRKVLANVSRSQARPGAPQVEGSQEDAVAAERARAFLAKKAALRSGR